MAFKPPGKPGRPPGLRNQVTQAFLKDFLDSWKRDGIEALMMAAKEDPMGYVRVAASLLPKEVSLEIERPLQQLSDEQVQALVEAYQQQGMIDITPSPVPVKAIAQKEPDDE